MCKLCPFGSDTPQEGYQHRVVLRKIDTCECNRRKSCRAATGETSSPSKQARAKFVLAHSAEFRGRIWPILFKSAS